MSGNASRENSASSAPALGEWANSLTSTRIAVALIVAVAVATRVVAWWNPVADTDDQFYRLAGEQLLLGHWPYIDVWDRKPLGLFLLYSGIAWVSGGSTLGFNLVATAFAALTAWIIRKISLRYASPGAATMAALAYLLVIGVVGGQTGQSPVFYNLPMAGAALLLIGAAELPRSAVAKRALGAMLLCGLAMTVKQVSLIEGVYFGLAFLWLLRRQGIGAIFLIWFGSLMVLLAMLPTAAALAGYALAGRGALDAQVFATFISIFRVGGWGAEFKLWAIAFLILSVGPLALMAGVGMVDRRRKRGFAQADLLLVGWIASSFLGLVAVPNFFGHYALPLIAPLCVSAASFFDRTSGRLFFGALAISCVIQPPIRDARANQQARMEFDKLTAAVNEARQGGCIFIGDGPPRLYSSTGACQVTGYLFPDHLNLVQEADAVGVDTSAELARILASRPAVVVTQARDRGSYSPAYRHFLEQLRRSYRISYESAADAPPLVRNILVWRKDPRQPSG